MISQHHAEGFMVDIALRAFGTHPLVGEHLLCFV
jgi:hypothetical protein